MTKQVVWDIIPLLQNLSGIFRFAGTSCLNDHGLSVVMLPLSDFEES